MKVCKDCKHRLEHGFCKTKKLHVPRKVKMGRTISIAALCDDYATKK